MPAVALAVAVTLARPLASVTAEPALSVALAPERGAMKPIVAPGSGALAKVLGQQGHEWSVERLAD